MQLATRRMDEILAKPFADPSDLSTTLGPEADEPNRAAFDNIDDYHGYHDSTDSNATDFIKTSSGQTIGWISTDIYRRSVTVEYRATPAGAAVVARGHSGGEINFAKTAGHPGDGPAQNLPES